MRKALLAGPSSAQVRHQKSRLLAAGFDVVELPPHVGGGSCPVVWDDTDVVRVQGQRIDDVDVALVAQLPPEVPGGEAFESPLSFGQWVQHFAVARARGDTGLSACLLLEERGVPMCNAPSRSMVSRRKPRQLAVLRRLGVPTPPTVVTNCPETIRSAVQRWGEAIAKPAAGGALTLDITSMGKEEFDAFKLAPAIVQQRVRGVDLRVVVVGDAVVSSVSVDVPEDTLDFRGDNAYQSGHGRYTEVALPDDLEQRLVQATAALGLVVAGIDVKHNAATNTWTVLEVNSSPIYFDVERKLEHPITDAIVAWLTSAAAASRGEAPSRT